MMKSLEIFKHSKCILFHRYKNHSIWTKLSSNDDYDHKLMFYKDIKYMVKSADVKYDDIDKTRQ